MSLPDKMKAIVLVRPGGVDQMQLMDLDLPVCKPDEVLVQVAGAGVNRPDVLQRKGLYPPPPDANPGLGLEVAGRIVAHGEHVSCDMLGRSVMALVNGGGYAEYVAVPAGQCMPVPVGLSLIQAAALPEVYMTVWQNVFLKGGLQAGQSILIHGGSSGIGSAAIGLAKRRGAKVLVTVGNRDKADHCKRLGADRVFLYPECDWVAEVLSATGNRGVDLVLDMVAGDYLDKNLSCVALGGAILVIALLGGNRANLDVSKLLLKQVSLHGTTLRIQTPAFKAELAQAVAQELQDGFARGVLASHVTAVFDLADVDKAHALMESGRHFGKIVLKVSDVQ